MMFSPSEIDLEEERKKEFLFYCHIFFYLFLSSVSVDENNMVAKVLKVGKLRCAYYAARKVKIEGAKWREKNAASSNMTDSSNLFMPFICFTQFIVIFFFFLKNRKGSAKHKLRFR